MLDRLKYFMIRDICMTDLTFYDKDDEERQIDFCTKNNITYLPARDRKSCYQLVDGKFEHVEAVPENAQCTPEDLIFKDETIGKFEADGNHDEVLFVMEDDYIKGIVHIVDYNNPQLYVELYRMLLAFENNLRKVLKRKRYVNDDLIIWLSERSKDQTLGQGERNYYTKAYNRHTSSQEERRRHQTNPFQTFYLKELLQFMFSEQLVIGTIREVEDISDVRNWVAHSRDVTAIHPDSEHPVYNIQGLKRFINQVRLFFKVNDRLLMVLEGMA